MNLLFTTILLATSDYVRACMSGLGRPILVTRPVKPCAVAGHEDSAAICSLPVKAGDCRGMIPRYFYNKETSSCMEFNFSGCGGNGNNFETLHDCEKMCSSAKNASDSVSDCSSQPDGGLCMAYMERYAFNPATRACEKFVYGGCGGNGNRYSSAEECEQHCANSSVSDHHEHQEQQEQQQHQEQQQEEEEEVCLLPRDIGPCKALVMRFFFNTEIGACQVFLYGGCGGNANNFKAIEDCVRHCEEDDAYQPDPFLHRVPHNDSTAINIDSIISNFTSDHDTRVCGVPECPMDCGLVRQDGDCLLCRCAPSPLAETPEPIPTL